MAEPTKKLNFDLENSNVDKFLFGLYSVEHGNDGTYDVGKLNLPFVEEGTKNVVTSTARGGFQFVKSTRNEILSDYGFDAWSGDVEEQKKAALALIQKNKPDAVSLINDGDFEGARTTIGGVLFEGLRDSNKEKYNKGISNEDGWSGINVVDNFEKNLSSKKDSLSPFLEDGGYTVRTSWDSKNKKFINKPLDQELFDMFSSYGDEGVKSKASKAPTAKLSVTDFAEKIKSKYPQYEELEDTVLVEKILAKYPEYSEKVELKKKEESLPESTTISPQSDSEAPSTELTLEESKNIVEEELDKGLWSQFSNWTVKSGTAITSSVLELLGQDKMAKSTNEILNIEKDNQDKIKKAQNNINKDIIANPESNLSQYELLQKEKAGIESGALSEYYAPKDKDGNVDMNAPVNSRLDEINNKLEMMSPSINKVISANWYTENVLNNDGINVNESQKEEIFTSTYKSYLKDVNPEKLKNHETKVASLQDSESKNLLPEELASFDVQANEWYNNTVSTVVDIAKNKKRFNPETGEEYTLQNSIDNVDVLRTENKEYEDDISKKTIEINEKIKSSEGISEEIKENMQSEFDEQAKVIVDAYTKMAESATTQEEIDAINDNLKLDVSNLEVQVTNKYNGQFAELEKEIQTLNRQRGLVVDKYSKSVNEFNKIVGSDDFLEYRNAMSQYDKVEQDTDNILKKYPAAYKKKLELEDRQIWLDKKAKGEDTSELEYQPASVGEKYFPLLNKQLYSAVESIFTLGRTVTAGGEYDALEQFGDFTEYAFQGSQVQNSSRERSLVESVVNYNGYKITLGEDGTVADVRDKDGFKIRNSAKVKEIAVSYLDTPEDQRPKEEMLVNSDLLLVKTTDTMIDMAELIYGGQLATKGLSMLSKFEKANKMLGLTTSGFVAQHNGLYNEAIDIGINKNEASNFAIIGGTILAGLENISPGEGIFDAAVRKKIAKNYIEILAKGSATKGDAARVVARNVFNEVKKENIQEISQSIAEKAVKYSTNKMIGSSFDTSLNKEEVLETVILTSLSSGLLSGSTQLSSQTPSNLEANALYSAVKDKDQTKMFNTLDNMVKNGTIDIEASDRTKSLIIEGKELFSKIPEGKYNNVMESQILALQVIKNKALKEKNASDSVFGKQYDTTIKQIDKEINSIINSKSPRIFFNERIKNLNVETAPRLAKLNQDYVSGKITQEQYDKSLKSIVNPSNGVVIDALQEFGRKIGRPFKKTQALKPLDIQKAIAIADAYENMQHDPSNPEVKQAYDAFKKETKEQFEHFKSLGFTFKPAKGDNAPYSNSKELTDDVSNNKNLFFLPTENEFGTGDPSIDNPLLEKTGVVIDGYELSFNDMFRVVHDMASHVAYGHQFGPLGEMNAYEAHKKTYSIEAQRALFSETMGQSSYVNYGSHLRNQDGKVPKKGEKGYVPLAMRPYAPQKAGLLPVELMTESSQEQEALNRPYQDLVSDNVDAKLDSILEKIENNQELNEKEIDEAKKYLDQIFNQVINSNITQQGKSIMLDYLELVENTLDNYENIVTTKTVTVAETKVGTYAERGAIKKRVSEYSKTVKPGRERLVGRTVQLDGLELPEGSVAVLNQDADGVFIEVVNEETGERSQRIDLGTNNPNELSIDSIQMDEFDRPSSVILKIGENVITVTDPLLVMDLAIEKHEEVNPIYEQEVEVIQYGVETITEQEVTEKVKKTEEEITIEQENKNDLEKIEEQIQMSQLSNKSLKGKGLIKLTQKLQDAFPNVPVKIINSNQAEALLPGRNAGKSKGFAFGGAVYIVSDNVTMDTPIHEMAHIFNIWAKKYAPELYAKGISLIKGTKYEENVRNNPNYSNLDEEGILEEALTQAIGEKGALLESKEEKAGFKAWLKRVFDLVRKAGVPVNMTIGQYTDLVAGSLLSGNKISDITPEELVEIDSDPKLNALFSFVYDNNLDPNNGAVVTSRIIKSLEEAKSYSKDGMSALQVRKATGWTQAKDGFWRFEVSDSDLKFNDSMKKEMRESMELYFETGNRELLSYSMPIETMFDGNMLSEFYPQLKSTPVSFDSFNDNSGNKGSAKTLMPHHINEAIRMLSDDNLKLSSIQKDALTKLLSNFKKSSGYISNDITLNPLVTSKKYTGMYVAFAHSDTVETIRSLGITSKTAIDIFLKSEGITSLVLQNAIFDIVSGYGGGRLNIVDSSEYKLGYATGGVNLLDLESDNVEDAKDLFYNNLFEQIKSTFLHEQQHIAQAIASVSKGGNLRTIEQFDLDIQKTIDEGTTSKKDISELKFNSYQNLLGEIEARVVQSRMNYGQETLDAIDVEDVQEAIIVSHAQALISEFAGKQSKEIQNSIVEKLINYSKEKAIERMESTNIAPKFSFPSERKGFNEWFGDSKIVNQDGTPMVMYHGTKRVFDEFKVKESSQLVDAIFFSPNPEFADNYTKANISDKISGETLYPSLMPSYISSPNPFDYENPSHVRRLTNSMSGIDIEMMGIAMGFDSSLTESETVEAIERYISNTDNNWVVLEGLGANIKRLGFDAMHIAEKGNKNIAIFKGQQAKSSLSLDYSTLKFSMPYEKVEANPALSENVGSFENIVDSIQNENGKFISMAEFEARKNNLLLPESQRQKPKGEQIALVEALERNEITQKEYNNRTKEVMPITPIMDKSMQRFPSILDVAASLDKNKVEKGIIGLNKEVPENYYVGLRLDIPAYDRYNTWVVSVHEGAKLDPKNSNPQSVKRTPNIGGKSIGYGQTGVIKNVSFESSSKAALNIAKGEKNKSTIARMFGNWNNHNPKELSNTASGIMNSEAYNSSAENTTGQLDGWIQVGMNPYRHSYFYDKRDGMPIVAAGEVIQVGALVLAKNAYKVSAENLDPFISNKTGEEVKFSKPSQNELKDLVSELVNQGYTKGQILEAFSNQGYDLNDVNNAFDSLVEQSIKNTFVKEQEAPRQNNLVPASENVSVWQGLTSRLKNAGKYFTNLFTPQGQLRKEVYELIETKSQNIRALISKVNFTQRKVNNIIKNIIKGPTKMSNQSYVDIVNTIEKALRGEISFSELTETYGVELAESVEEMRNQIDSLSNILIDSGITQDNIALKMIDNLGSYLTRSYALYDDPAFSDKSGSQIRDSYAKDPNKTSILNNAINYLRREQSQKIYDKIMDFYESEMTRLNEEFNSNQITKEQFDVEKSKISDILSNKDGKLTEAFENELLNTIDNILNKEQVGFLGIVGALSSKDSKVLKERKDIAPEIRALMGEYNDPMYNYANTVVKIYSLIEQQKLLNKLKDVGYGDFIFSANDPNRPGDSVQIAAESNDALAPLNGMYIDPVVLKELQDVTNPEQRSAILQKVFDFVSWTRESKTTLSPMTHMRNVLGNLGFILMNGHVGFMSPKAGGNSIRTVMYDLNILDNKMAKLLGAKKILTDQDRKDVELLIEKLTALGVIRQNVSVNDIIDLSQNGDFDYYFSKNMDGYQSNENSRLSAMIGAAKRGVNVSRKMAQELYQAEDDMFKIYAFAMERNRYESALRKKGMTESQIDDFVAERIKNTYPTYSRVGKAIEWVRKAPFLGDFLSFKYESIRTMKNTILIAASDMKDPDLRVQGVKRMASTLGYLGLKTAIFKLIGGAASNAFLGLFGAEDEEDKRKIINCRKFLPEYDEFGAINVTKINPDGTFEYTNVGAVDPHSDLEEVLTSIDLLRDPDYGNESTAIAISKSIGNYIGSYLGLSMGSEASLQIRDILLDPTLTDDAKQIKIISEMDVLLPGFVTQINKVSESEDKLKVLKGMLLGVRESKSDPRFKIRRELENLSGKISSERSLVYKNKNGEQYRKSIDSVSNEVEYMKDLIDSARYLGVPNSEIKKMINNPRILLPKQVRRELYVGISTGIWFTF